MADILRVLCVDDEPNILDLCKIYLERTGEFSVDIVLSGEEALTQLGKKQYDAIVSDYQMPEMDGISLLKQVRATQVDISFILFTGRGREEIVIEAINNGVDFYLQKGGDPRSQFTELAHKIVSAATGRRSEQAFRESEEKFRYLVENALEPILILDFQGKILFANNGVAKLIEVSDYAGLIGRNVMEFIAQESREDVIRDFIQVYQGHDGFLSHYHVMGGNGKKIYVESIGKVVTYEGKPADLISIRDITESKRADDALLESEQKFRETTNHIPGVVFQFVAKPDGSLQLPYVSDRIKDILGIEDTRGDLFQSLTSRIHPDDKAGFFASVDESVRSGGPWRAEARFIKPSGETIWLQGMSSPVEHDDGLVFYGVLTDISDRKQAEEAQRQIFENNALGMTLALPDFRFHLVNPAFVSMLGYSEEEFRKMSFKDVTHPDYLTGDIEGVRALAEGSIPVYSTEKRYIRKDGSTLWGALTVTTIRNHDGTLRYYLAQIEDITQRKRAAELVNESENKFASVFNGSPVALTLVSAIDGTFVDVNDAFVRSTGYTREEVIGTTSEALGIFTDLNERRRLGSSLREHRIVENMEISIRVKTGEIRPCLFSTGIILIGGKPYILSTVRDNLARKQAEEALRESEEKFREIFNSATDGFHLHEINENFVPGKYVDVNEVVCRSLQYSKQELLEKGPRDISTEYHNPAEEQIGKELREKGHSVFETGHIRKDGTVIPVEITAHVIRIRGKKLVLSIARDITERRNTEIGFRTMVTSMVGTTGMDSLRKITENISSWLGADCVMIGEIQPDGQTVLVLSMLLDGKEIPDYSYTLKGTPCDHVAEKGFCMYPDNAIQLFPESRDLVELNIKGYIGTPLKSSEGQVLGVLCALFRNPVVKPPGMQEIMNIIAVKAAAEIEGMRMMAALRQSEEDLAQVMNGVPTLISYMDTELRFISINKAHLEWYGRTEQELIGKSLKDLLPDDVFQRALPYYQQVLGGREVTFENPTRDKDGRKRILLVRMLPHLHGEQVVGIFAAIDDITELKRAEEAVRLANRKLHLLSSLTRHDINNQLTVLLGYLDILNDSELEPSQKEYFQKVDTAAQRISSMIRFTQEYEEIGVHAPAWQELHGLIDTEAMDTPLGTIMVKNDLPAGTEVNADPLISKVFYNLMDNAVRYGGKITNIRFSADEHNSDYIIVCEDDGEGIPAAEKEKIFERGFGRNTGMGLFLSREILSITGIMIRETGEPGKGARFEMTVPKGMWRIKEDGE